MQRDMFAQHFIFLKQEEKPYILPATGHNIALKFDATADKSSYGPKWGGRRSLGPDSSSSMRTEAKRKNIANLELPLKTLNALEIVEKIE